MRRGIRARLVFDGYTRQDWDAVVVLEGDRILWVGRPEDAPACPIIDLRGMFLLPGLIDPHVHLEWSAAHTHAGVRADYLREAAKPPELAARARLNALELVRSGVTTARDCGSSHQLLKLREDIAQGIVGGPDLLVCGPPITKKRGHLFWMGQVIDGRPSAERAVREAAAAGVDGIKVIASGGFLTPESSPFAPQFTASLLECIQATANESGLPVVAHAHDVASIQRCVDAGIGTIDHGLFYGRDGRQRIVKPVLEAMATADVALGLSGSGTLRSNLGAEGGIERIASTLAPHRQARAQGVRVLIHSDAGAHATSFGGFAETLRVAQVGLGLQPEAILRIVTSGAAAALGLGNRAGAIRAGMRADLVITRADPLVDLANLAAVEDVIARGRCVRQNYWT
ncbi:MAG TPA: amidohydrolase family protein [Propionibacteriaceae bacterium]|nr:amidohydrolase family protein [Propionibacteriaceae bacterium]